MERLVSNRYRLIEPIGEGGMGVVWRAHDEVLDRPVAVKEVRYEGIGDARRAELNQRTIREARAAGRLDHPSVVVVYDVVEEDGRPWIVMNLVRSRSLAQVIREDGPLPPARVAAIGAALLDALRTAHAAGVLHRDVKPENVLLAADGRVVLTDFGIATMEAEQGLTATGGLVGTPAYMPPERLNGLPAVPESDLWALGATLYTAVEGKAAFRGDSWAATVAAVLRDAPDPPVRAGALTPVVEGLMRREPATRLPAAEAAALLAAVSSGSSGTAEPGVPPAPAGGGPWGHAPAPGHGGYPGTAAQDTLRTGFPLPGQGVPTAEGRTGPGSHARPSGYTRPSSQEGSGDRPGPGHGSPGGYPGPGGQAGSDGYPGSGGHAGPDGYAGSGGQAGPDGYAGTGGYPGSGGQAGSGGYAGSGHAGPGGRGGRGARGRRKARRPVVAAIAAGVLVLAGGGYLVAERLTGPGTSSAGPSTSPSVSPTAPATTASPVTPAPSSPAVPEGWRRVTSKEGGFSVAVPARWKGAKSKTRDSIAWTGPPLAGGQLIVEWTDDAWSDPVQHWRNVESDILGRKEFTGYRRIGLRPLTYLGVRAADWEFTRLRGTTRIHVLTRSFRTEDGRPFAIYWELPDGNWETHVNYFNTVVKYFRVV
ncbi:protein kinase [Nonomuraea typhae]|uniref:non-specific serine/threonine protein kinase n=1 Tax=Nonomuraea typhae TaxID=2603600 RepID=A0ABW7YQL4_9ACTN